MTKSEWENELYFQLKDIRASEKERIIDYYSEMYLDREELGMQEREILAEFGNPYDVAQKILSENKQEEIYQNLSMPYHDTHEIKQNIVSQSPEYNQSTIKSPEKSSTKKANVFAACRNNYGIYSGDETYRANDNDNTKAKVIQVILYITLLISIVLSAVCVGAIIFALSAVEIALFCAGIGTIGMSIASAIGAGFSGSVITAIGLGGLLIGLGLILIPVFTSCSKFFVLLLKKFYQQIIDGEISLNKKMQDGGDR